MDEPYYIYDKENKMLYLRNIEFYGGVDNNMIFSFINNDGENKIVSTSEIKYMYNFSSLSVREFKGVRYDYNEEYYHGSTDEYAGFENWGSYTNASTLRSDIMLFERTIEIKSADEYEKYDKIKSICDYNIKKLKLIREGSKANEYDCFGNIDNMYTDDLLGF